MLPRALPALLFALGLSLLPDPGARAADEPASKDVSVYFGLTLPDDGQVSEAQWQTYLETVLTPRFTDFSILDARDVLPGQAETLRIVIINIKPEERAALIEAVRIYAERFEQEGVLISEYGGPINTIVGPKGIIESGGVRH